VYVYGEGGLLEYIAKIHNLIPSCCKHVWLLIHLAKVQAVAASAAGVCMMLGPCECFLTTPCTAPALHAVPCSCTLFKLTS
jgi:hypothetical protein